MIKVKVKVKLRVGVKAQAQVKIGVNMNYIKKFGIRGFAFLAFNKINSSLNVKVEHKYRLPLLKDEPLISVYIYGEGDRQASLDSLKKQLYKNFAAVDLSEARGDYIGFLPAGDALDKKALYLMVEKLLRENADAVYCDEEGFYKPDFSPDTNLSCNYIGFFIIKRELAVNFENPVDLLKNYEVKVAHCSRPLVKSSRELVFYKEKIKAEQGGVSIIILSKDNYEVLKNCIDSIRTKTVYTDYEIIVADNGSTEQNAEKCRPLADKYIYEKKEFNFSHMCNIGAEAAEKRFLLFLNDDTEVISSDWLDKMTFYAGKPKSGAVGAKLYYPNSKKIQHCGVINIQPGPAHAFLGENDEVLLYKGRNRGVWNCTAVTAACLMVEKTKFFGFDEALRVAYNDVELCMSLINRGFYNMIVNEVVLYHYESLSRGDDRLNKEKLKRLALERRKLFDKHPEFSGRDDFYNVNLSPYRVDFAERSYVPYDRARAYKRINVKEKGEFEYKLEYAISDDRVQISGYGFKKGFNRLYVLLKKCGSDECFCFKPVKEMRTDIDAIYGREGLLSGFCLLLEVTDLSAGQYDVGIMLCGRGKRLVKFTDKQVSFLESCR